MTLAEKILELLEEAKADYQHNDYGRTEQEIAVIKAWISGRINALNELASWIDPIDFPQQ